MFNLGQICRNLKASLMSFTCRLYSDKVRCFNQSECALYGNFIIINNNNNNDNNNDDDDDNNNNEYDDNNSNKMKV